MKIKSGRWGTQWVSRFVFTLPYQHGWGVMLAFYSRMLVFQYSCRVLWRFTKTRECKKSHAKSNGVKCGEQQIITTMLVSVITNTRKHLTQCVDSGGFTYLIEFSKLISKTLRIYLYYNNKIKNLWLILWVIAFKNNEVMLSHSVLPMNTHSLGLSINRYNSFIIK